MKEKSFNMIFITQNIYKYIEKLGDDTLQLLLIVAFTVWSIFVSRYTYAIDNYSLPKIKHFYTILLLQCYIS